MHAWVALAAEMVGGHHPPEGRCERPLWIGQKSRDASERLLFLGVEDMENRANQQRVTGLFPVIAPFERALWVDRSEEHTSELQSLMRISYAVFCLTKKQTSGTPHNEYT